MELGLPGARDEVRAYAKRVDTAIQEFNNKDVLAATDKLTPSNFYTYWGWVKGTYTPFKTNWDEFYKSLDVTILIGGPSPSEAWQKTLVFENELKKRRKEFKDLGFKVVTEEPKELEKEGGIKQPPLFGISTGVLVTGLLLVGGLIGTAMVISAVKS